MEDHTRIRGGSKADRDFDPILWIDRLGAEDSTAERQQQFQPHFQQQPEQKSQESKPI